MHDTICLDAVDLSEKLALLLVGDSLLPDYFVSIV